MTTSMQDVISVVYKAADYPESVVADGLCMLCSGLCQALTELEMVSAAEPDGADKYFEAANVISKQVLTVSQALELCVFCMLPALQGVMTNCMLAATAV